ncbi:MAG: Gfo/Idh/MocA family oxidoreductase [Pseudomonadota bacterium]
MEQLRWGILSAAKIAKEWVAPAIHASHSSRISAIASRTAGKAEALAAPFGVLQVHDTYEDLLADPQVDAIYIPLPNGAHVEWTEKGLAAGKHVLCEKPIALTEEGVDRLIVARDAANRFAAEAFMVTHHPQWHRARDLVSQGAIGDLVHVQGAFSFFNTDPQNIRNRADQGGGALRDIGVYPSIVTRFVTGQEPETIRAEIDWDAGIDATARVWASFPGFDMDFYVSMRMAPRQQMVFHGTTGWLAVETPFNAKLYGDDVLTLAIGDTLTRERFPLVDQYVEQIDAFAATVRTGAPYACPLEFSKGNQRMIDMIYTAAKA